MSAAPSFLEVIHAALTAAGERELLIELHGTDKVATTAGAAARRPRPRPAAPGRRRPW